MLYSLLLATTLSAAPAFAEGACVDYASDPSQLTTLEADASKGALSQPQKDCLESSYAAAAEQTVKDKISRVLLVNAYAYNTSHWAKLVERHLEEVDRSDPNIAYLYAFYLYNTSPDRAEEAVRWTEIALERRDAWTGNVYVSRVYGLMKLRAIASGAQWQAAEDQRVSGAVTDVVVDELRNKTKTFAREWVDFAKVAGRDPAESLQLCLSAATRAIACGVEE